MELFEKLEPGEGLGDAAGEAVAREPEFLEGFQGGEKVVWDGSVKTVLG